MEVYTLLLQKPRQNGFFLSHENGTHKAEDGTQLPLPFKTVNHYSLLGKPVAHTAFASNDINHYSLPGRPVAHTALASNVLNHYSLLGGPAAHSICSSSNTGLLKCSLRNQICNIAPPTPHPPLTPCSHIPMHEWVSEFLDSYVLSNTQDPCKSKQACAQIWCTENVSKKETCKPIPFKRHITENVSTCYCITSSTQHTQLEHISTTRRSEFNTSYRIVLYKNFYYYYTKERK